MFDTEKDTVVNEQEERSSNISEDHREYLLRRHGSAELDPLPDMNDDDPLNWSNRQKHVVYSLVVFHAMMSPFTATAISSCFVNVSQDLDVSIQATSYLGTLQIPILGIAPFFWRPLANTWGRRPILLVSLIGAFVCNIGCANSPNYASMAGCRALEAWFISPAAAIGSGIAAELFFKRQRAFYIGIWTVMVTLGIPLGPLIFGFVVLRVNYRWIYYILAIVNAVQLICWLALGSETFHIRGQTSKAQGLSLRFRRIDPRPLSALDFLKPLHFFNKPCVLLPAVAYAMIFSFANILVGIEISELYPVTFDSNPQQVGLQMISLVVGSLIGEAFGGFISDSWMHVGSRRKGKYPVPEYRLWLSYLAFPLAIAGVVIFLVCLAEAGSHWTVSPDIGAAIASVGNQITTTIYITYAVDCYPGEASGVGVFITFIRQLWAFVGPFWYPEMIDAVGLRGSAGIATALMAVVAFPVCALLQWRGACWR